MLYTYTQFIDYPHGYISYTKADLVYFPHTKNPICQQRETNSSTSIYSSCYVRKCQKASVLTFNFSLFVRRFYFRFQGTILLCIELIKRRMNKIEYFQPLYLKYFFMKQFLFIVFAILAYWWVNLQNRRVRVIALMLFRFQWTTVVWRPIGIIKYLNITLSNEIHNSA